ncbi:MAG: aminotransferase class III-fold pyridoxal phosphate-dependent enzyme, partial [Microlunatus sp.]|nr:aminotransferase class III-fold pyridoxal phosphate-dependent enzyme [Microlunatus sp.]
MSDVRASGPAATQTVLDAAAPRLTPERAVRLVAQRWGLSVREARALPSERDVNVMLDDRYVLKVSNPAEQPAIIEMETVAADHLAAVAPEIPVPRTLPAPDGALVVTVLDDTGRECRARVITTVPGAPLEGSVITAQLAEQLGALTARTSLALQGLFHPAAGRVIDWDVRRAADVVRATPDAISGAPGRLLHDLLPRLDAAAAATRRLPAGLQHADVTLTNVLAVDAEISGLIDFGDMHHTAAVCDLAVALTSVLRNSADEQPLGVWELIDVVLRGYQQHRLLTADEVAVLGDLVLARLAITLVISARRRATHIDNTAYITQHDAASIRVLGEIGVLDHADLSERLARLAGTAHAGTVSPTTSLGHRRAAVMGGGLSPLFYRAPLEIIRGEGPWLYAADGRRYLDAYNNVAVVGHAHPAVTRAVSQQLGTLNTHSRYLHPAAVELAERLLATVPDELDTCLFTTSGTEANDLAWRLATAYTGGTGAVVAEHAYHGSSKWLADLSPNEWPRGYRPPHVATFAAPRPTLEGLGHDVAVARIDAACAALADRGDRLALVLADTAFTSEGVWDAPADFLAGLVDGAHRNGGLYLADEVQCGYHRTGEHLWRFTAGGIVPDIFTLGKPMGAGYPVGAVLPRREIADALAQDYEYFSTFAATPAAAVAGLTVLDLLQHTSLPQQIVDVGNHLRAELAALDSSRLGAVRGRGLIVGVDLSAPEGVQARAFGTDLVNGLVRRGVLAGLTGPGRGVLKV